MKVQGACHCGRITFEAEIDPEKVGLCHCTDCQVLTGSAYRISVPASKEGFRLLSGQPKFYVKTADSGTKRAQGFCADCGTPLFATAPVDFPPDYMLRVASLRQRPDLPPKRRIWCSSALAWSTDIGGIPGIERQL